MRAAATPSAQIEVALKKPVYGGDCLGAVVGGDERAGKTVFVSLGLPGETVAAQITEEKRSFAKAELNLVITPSPSRVAPRCPYFGTCGGCHYQHADYQTQLRLKQEILAETLARAGVRFRGQIEILAGDPWGYRNRIRLAVLAKTSGQVEIGYRGRRSHDLVAIRECPIASPALVENFLRIASFLAETPANSRVSEIELFTNSDETQLLVTLFVEPREAIGNGAPSFTEEWLQDLQRALSIEDAGIRILISDGGLDPRVAANFGPGSLVYRAAGLDYQVDQGAFFQVNGKLVNDFVKLAIEGSSDDSKEALAWDLFAGVGLFARQLCTRYQKVMAVESAPASMGALERNLAGTSGQAIRSTTLEFLRRNRQEREARPDLIVMDPPRAGLGEETSRLLTQIHASQMVYVSCDPATLARDLKTLTAERFRIDGITLVDMFPQTFHLETVVRLGRC